MQTVRLRTAYAWDCETCGRENFANGVIVEMDEARQQELREEQGVEEPATGDFVMIPETVTCQFCGEEFETVDARADGPPDDL